MYRVHAYLPLVAALAAAFALMSGASAQDQRTGVTVTGTAEAQARPDVANVSFGVVTEDRDATRAAQENARITTAVIDAVVGFGVARADIQTTQYSVSPIVDYQRTPPVTTGYRVTNLVRVKLRDLARIGALIDTAIAAGANNVQGVSFDIQDPTPVRREALVQAMRSAQADARLIADTLGIRLGRIVSVTESGPAIPRPFELGAVRAEAATTPIIPGQITVSATVTVVYSIL